MGRGSGTISTEGAGDGVSASEILRSRQPLQYQEESDGGNGVYQPATVRCYETIKVSAGGDEGFDQGLVVIADQFPGVEPYWTVTSSGPDQDGKAFWAVEVLTEDPKTGDDQVHKFLVSQ